MYPLSKIRKVTRGLLTVKEKVENLLLLGIALLWRIGQVLYHVLGLKIDDFLEGRLKIQMFKLELFL